ncbi:hypothetical protein FRC03_009160 [Tulasnella sp. 419]|nr:hypothetical protein FRC02_006485 [Tulasnella sp. 418]KAG8967873.1 hypothetical protein FRC03_009160 [Tulasnella sp. 419]
MPQLPMHSGDEVPSQASQRAGRSNQKTFRRMLRAVMRSRSLTLPAFLPDLPIRWRPWFLLFTSLIMLLLALLGFTNIANNWPLDDKILHFVCLGLATGVFYFIFDADEDARRIWFWRYAPVIATLIICFFFGGIVSEIVQGLLPYKTFDIWDVVANLLGSSVGLYVSFHAEKYYRSRREISRLYQPLDDDLPSDDEDDDVGPAAAYLPVLSTASGPSGSSRQKNTGGGTGLVFPSERNVWDDRVNVFDVGAEEEDSDDAAKPTRSKR